MVKGFESLAWEKMGGLVPAVVQDNSTLQILMLGYMNREALEKTLSTGRVTFFSRSKGRIWEKGESSEHSLKIRQIKADCDGDALILSVDPLGPTCHLGTVSCFGTEEAQGVGFLGKLWRIIEDRYQKRPVGSYTTKLFNEGVDRMAQKVGEEAVEVAIAAKNEDEEALANEVSDLLYHLMVLLKGKGLTLERVLQILRSRH